MPRAGASCVRVGVDCAPVSLMALLTARPMRGEPARRMRVNAIRARATSNVLSELSHEVRRFERGEGGGVT